MSPSLWHAVDTRMLKLHCRLKVYTSFQWVAVCNSPSLPQTSLPPDWWVFPCSQILKTFSPTVVWGTGGSGFTDPVVQHRVTSRRGGQLRKKTWIWERLYLLRLSQLQIYTVAATASCQLTFYLPELSNCFSFVFSNLLLIQAPSQ